MESFYIYIRKSYRYIKIQCLYAILCSTIKENEFGQFLLIDNATFHSLDEFVKQEMEKKAPYKMTSSPLDILSK